MNRTSPIPSPVRRPQCDQDRSRRLGGGPTLLAGGLLLALATLSGCPDGDKRPTKDAKNPAMLALEVQGDAEVEKYDLNGDRKPDVWKYFNRVGDKSAPAKKRERLLAKKELDVNFDGKVDMRQFFNKFGDVVREEMDLDFDGHFDAVDYYLDGELYKREIAMNFAEKPNVWKYFDNGTLRRKERDTNADGRPDVFEYYAPDGGLTRIGYDRDGDGKPDFYDDVAHKEQK